MTNKQSCISYKKYRMKNEQGWLQSNNYKPQNPSFVSAECTHEQWKQREWDGVTEFSRGVTHHAVHVELERSVVVGSRFVEMDEEEEVRPLVVLLLDVLLETLHIKTTQHKRNSKRDDFKEWRCPHSASVLEVVAVSAADEAGGAHVFVDLPLAVAQLGEGVHDDTEDDVQADRGDDDEEGQVEDGLPQMEVERLIVGDLQELSQHKQRESTTDEQ